jgi:hypothetical protein
VALIELKDDREIYYVAPSMVPELNGEFYAATLYLTINRQKVVTIWPVRLPSPDGKHSPWHRSAADAAEIAQTRWVRIRPDMSLGAYIPSPSG